MIMDKLGDRINHIIYEEKTNAKVLAEKLGYSSTYIYGLRNGKITTPSIEFLFQLEEMGYSIHWVANGEGEIRTEKIVSTYQLAETKQIVEKKYESIIAEKNKRIHELEEWVSLLREKAGMPNFHDLSRVSTRVMQNLRKGKNRKPAHAPAHSPTL
jgi:transcriptional regulator with XRE-family HTH domain